MTWLDFGGQDHSRLLRWQRHPCQRYGVEVPSSSSYCSLGWCQRTSVNVVASVPSTASWWVSKRWGGPVDVFPLLTSVFWVPF